MSRFRELLESNKKEYHFRIKSIVDLNNHVESLERVLNKYELLEVGKIKKTILQDNPLDFTAIDAGEVYIFDAILHIPVSAYALRLELAEKLDIPESYIVVRTDNDPMEVETERLSAIRELDAENEGLEPLPLLSTDSEYIEEPADGNLFAGNDYNDRFLTLLAQQTKLRKEKETVSTKSGLFNWLEDNGVHVEASEDFNKDIADAPKVHNYWDQKEPEKRDVDALISNAGNVDDDKQKFTKRYKKKDDSIKTSSKDSDSIRD